MVNVLNLNFVNQGFRQNATCKCKQCRPRSDCFWWSSLIRVYTVCHYTISKYFKELHKKQNLGKINTWNCNTLPACNYQVKIFWCNNLLKLSSQKRKYGRGGQITVKNWSSLPISNPKPDLHNINAHTKFGGNSLLSSRHKILTNGQRIDGHTSRLQRETIILCY